MITDPLAKPCTAFNGGRFLCAGPLIEVAMSVRNAIDGGGRPEDILTFDDATGRIVDLDLRGSKADIIARLTQVPEPRESARKPRAAVSSSAEPRGRGRPKLGVIAREITLLPRHWDWLATQPGGASVALRKLVEEARRDGGGREKLRKAQEAANRFMTAMAGDLPGFEEATRALFANDRMRFERQISDWPEDIRVYATFLAFSESKAFK